MAPDPVSFASRTIEIAIEHHKTGRFSEAEALYRKVLAVDPNQFDALHLLGVIAHQAGKYKEAIELISRALKRDPAAFPAHNNLGLAYRALNDLESAQICFRTAVSLNPEYIPAYINLSMALQAQGKLAEAIACHRKILALDSESGDAHYNLAQTLAAQDRQAEALAEIHKAILIKPELAEAHLALGVMLHRQGISGDALDCFRTALSLRPDSVQAHWIFAVSRLAGVYGVGEDPDAGRAEFGLALADLDRWFDARRSKNGFEAVGVEQPFFLAYHERNNRDLLCRYGDLCARLMKHWQETQEFPPRGNRRDGVVRVGLVSGLIREHSVWTAWTKGFCEHLDPDRFSLHIFYTGKTQDQETAFARSRASRFTHGLIGLRQWVEAILDQDMDVLVYPEIAFDATLVQLASMRIAPVQVTTWGHPETSGLPTIDYYLSASCFEPSDAKEHYRERLVTLPNLGCCWEALRPPDSEIDLAALGIVSDAPILVCPGTPFKYAPEHDWILVEIARRLSRCQLVFFRHDRANLTNKFERRLDSAFEQSGLNYSDYCVFIPWLPRTAFYSLLRRADVYVDTIGFSGFNTAMQAVECGLPIVTRDGRFLRGRLGSGILKRMGLPELVAQTDQEFVEVAVELASNGPYRRQIRERIKASRSVLFDDVAPIRALEAFLIGVTQRESIDR
jgi:predicted O-linked N-acetylglucosamine transferase (SPINDLY family)